MPLRYFELLDDVSLPGRWELGELTDSNGQEVENPWMFIKGEPIQADVRLKASLSRPGSPLDFSMAGVGSAPVIHEKVAQLLAQLAPGDVQLITVEVASQSEPYFIANATRVIRCIDDQASAEVRYWKPEDGRPEKTGKYRAVYGMRIDPAKVGSAQLFRPWGWTGSLIVSEHVKEAFEQTGLTGMKFKEVTGLSAISPQERERNRRLMELREQTDTARHAFWRTLGRLDEELIIPIVVGGSWPARRQVWRVIHRPEGRTLLVTDGLSDFFVDRVEPSVGFGLELALETDEPLGDIEKSWPLLLLERVGDEVAEHERVRERLKTGSMSMEVSGNHMPEPLVTAEGRVGVLLGSESSTLPRHFQLPSGQVRMVTVQVLLPRELAYLLEHGKQGREELVRRLGEPGGERLSRASRKPVV